MEVSKIEKYYPVIIIIKKLSMFKYVKFILKDSAML